jgi:hypothetical protein
MIKAIVLAVAVSAGKYGYQVDATTTTTTTVAKTTTTVYVAEHKTAAYYKAAETPYVEKTVAAYAPYETVVEKKKAVPTNAYDETKSGAVANTVGFAALLAAALF